jgi:SAM-dependent methyltransferase
MTSLPVRVSPEWLVLREPADATARASDLVEQVQRSLTGDRTAVVHDLGCGTGSMGRWLAPRLAGAQHWIMYDRDADLLDHASADMPGLAADGARVTVETRQRDITRLDPDDLPQASLITASALLDMFTADELERFVTACAEARCPVLVTISVIGRVDLVPADPLDLDIVDAFNAHQRRTTGGRRLLGPDAVGAAAAAFTRLGAEVLVRPSPWRLGPDQAALAAEWLAGWVSAACEQRPELAAPAAAYTQRRLDEAASGRLGVTVHHHDLLARPR